MNNPREAGYIFPAEWEEHDGILLAWPHDLLTFPQLEHVEQAYLAIIQALVGSEKVHLLVTGKKMKSRVQKLLAERNIPEDQVIFYEHDYADVWCRDYGPTFVIHKARKMRAMVKWTFNSWGNKYPELLKDDDVPSFLNKTMNLPFFTAGMVGEGGGLETNGKDTLLTTESCLLNKNRNPGKTKQQIETILRNHLGLMKIIWLQQGIVGDDTDGHIDNLARFVDEKTIVCSYAEKDDLNFAGLDKNYQKLTNVAEMGKKFTVIKLPLPTVYDGTKRLSASYANFYIANKVVLVPQFNVVTDNKAIEVLRPLFPQRKLVGIDCSQVVYGCGTIHCISQQIPKV